MVFIIMIVYLATTYWCLRIGAKEGYPIMYVVATMTLFMSVLMFYFLINKS